MAMKGEFARSSPDLGRPAWCRVHVGVEVGAAGDVVGQKFAEFAAGHEAGRDLCQRDAGRL